MKSNACCRKKAFFFTMDAAVALMFLLIASVIVFQVSSSRPYDAIHYKDMHFNAEDAMQILSLTKLSDLNETFVAEMINNTYLEEEDINKTLLDICGLLWSYNQTEYIENITAQTFTPLLSPDMKYTLKMKGIDTSTILYNSTIGFHEAHTITSASRIISGYKENVPSKGYTARSTIVQISKETSKYLYFGGFIGQGIISKTFTLPSNIDTVKKIYMEMDTGDNFTLHINGKYSGVYYRNASQTMLRANLKYNITNSTYLSYLQPNQNNITINFLSSELSQKYIGGGYIKILYNTTQLNTIIKEDKYYFPGIDGLFNLYSSFYVAGSMTNLTAFLHFNNNITNSSVYFKIANATVFVSNTTGEQMTHISQGQINAGLASSGLSYSSLSSKTIPIRFGFVEGSFAEEGGYGYGDAVLITDVSGSMGGCDVDSNCTGGLCDNSNPCHRSRINVAKEVDALFVEGMLNASGNNVGLVSFGDTTEQTHNLSNDETSLKSQINAYGATEPATCICCGINSASEILEKKVILLYLIENKSSWLYNTSYPSAEPPNDGSGRKWTDLNYNDTYWSFGNAILGFEDTPYAPNITTDIGSNYISSANNNCNASNYTLAECVHSDGTINDTHTENNISLNITSDNSLIAFFDDDFETYYGNGIHQIDGNDINATPGYWFVDDTGEEVFIMANQASYSAYSGTDVLVFRDMDSYGYARTTVDLTAYENPELSYWWRLGPNSFDSGEYADVRVWDGSWHTVVTYDTDDDDHIYRHAQIDLAGYNMINNFIVQFGCKSSWDDERFYVDNVEIKGTKKKTEIEFVSDSITAPLESIKANVKLKSNTTSDYYLFIFNYNDNSWESTLCENKTSTANAWTHYTCSGVENSENYLSADNKIKIKIIGFHANQTLTQIDFVNFSLESGRGDYYFRKQFTIDNVDGFVNAYMHVLSDDNAEVYINGHLVDNDTVKHYAKYWNRPEEENIFYDGFETYYGDGNHQIDGNDINNAPGFWFIDDTGEEIFIMANNPSYSAHNGTDVLVFRDMDSYGYARITVNLTGYSGAELSYWWKLGPNSFEPGEYGDVTVWDGQWHTVAVYDGNDDDNIYHYETIDLSELNLVHNFTIQFGCRSSWNDERFYIDDVSIKEKKTLNKSYLVNGSNVVAVKLINEDNISAKFDLQLMAISEPLYRRRAMLVMSDGQANRQCAEQGTGNSDNDAIQAGCDARDIYGITVYSVAFGSSADATTLRKIACWNCSANDWMNGTNATYCPRYYQSNNADELKSIYLEIAETMVNLSYTTQVITIEGVADNILFPDSYIYFNYTPITEEIKYKEVTVTIDRDKFGGVIDNPKNKTYNIPDGITVLDAKVSSYSSDYWTDYVYINNSDGSGWQKIYRLDDYEIDYAPLGDPYIVNIPSNLFLPNKNFSVSMNTGFNYMNSTGSSPDNRMIYTFKVPGFVGYGAIFPNKTAAHDDAKERLSVFLQQYGISLIDVQTEEYYVGKTPWMFGPAIFSISMWE
ncbi:MAG: hypothetical protein DRN66_01065 [Candidatus Nanohalarchaeota archaeon]|nr:MAG: hypothetical protein DRN66_01065 [Candidatus Nanohaloarchaeota archaeon]